MNMVGPNSNRRMNNSRRPSKRRGEFDKNAKAVRQADEKAKKLNDWIPKTKTGKLVKEGKIESYDQILAQSLPVMETEIVDFLFPNLVDKLIDIKKTTKVRRSGRMFGFRASVIVGDQKGYIGLGVAKDKEKWPAVEKATKQAKLRMVKVRRGCGSWECICGTGHSIPFKVKGKSASVKVELIPAPKGTGLVVGNKIKDVMQFVGIEDVWSQTYGSTDTTLNFVRAAIDALTKTTKMKMSDSILTKVKK